jgi:hypothetical protein
MFKPPPPLLRYALRYVFGHAEIAFVGGALDIDVLKKFPLQYMNILSAMTPELNLELHYEDPPALLHLLLEKDCIELAKALLARTSHPSDSGTSTHHNKVGTLYTQTHPVRPVSGEGRDSSHYMSCALSTAIIMQRKDFVKLTWKKIRTQVP